MFTWIKTTANAIKVIIVAIIFGVFAYLWFALKKSKDLTEKLLKELLILKQKSDADDKIIDMTNETVSDSKDVDKIPEKDDDTFTFGKMILIFAILLVSISCYQDRIVEVKPNIPMLIAIDKETLPFEELTFTLIDGKIELTRDQVMILYRNEVLYKNIIQFYENQIKRYLEFYNMYYKTREK